MAAVGFQDLRMSTFARAENYVEEGESERVGEVQAHSHTIQRSPKWRYEVLWIRFLAFGRSGNGFGLPEIRIGLDPFLLHIALMRVEGKQLIL